MQDPPGEEAYSTLTQNPHLSPSLLSRLQPQLFSLLRHWNCAARVPSKVFFGQGLFSSTVLRQRGLVTKQHLCFWHQRRSFQEWQEWRSPSGKIRRCVAMKQRLHCGAPQLLLAHLLQRRVAKLQLRQLGPVLPQNQLLSPS